MLTSRIMDRTGSINLIYVLKYALILLHRALDPNPHADCQGEWSEKTTRP